MSLWNDLSDPVFDGILYFSSFHGLVVWGWGLWTDRVFSLSPGLAQRTRNDDKNNNNTILSIQVSALVKLVLEIQLHLFSLLIILYKMLHKPNGVFHH